MEYKITLTDSQDKALSYICASQKDWIENAVFSHCIRATDEIVKTYTEKALDEGIQIPKTKDLIIDDAFARGWVKTGKERNEDFEKEIENK